MGANSKLRRMIKQIIFPLMNAGVYKYMQATSVAWDISVGNWYEPEVDLIPFAVKRGETVLDLGANFGFYSYYLSRAVGPQGASVRF